jgi:hypothetical protein
MSPFSCPESPGSKNIIVRQRRRRPPRLLQKAQVAPRQPGPASARDARPLVYLIHWEAALVSVRCRRARQSQPTTFAVPKQDTNLFKIRVCQIAEHLEINIVVDNTAGIAPSRTSRAIPQSGAWTRADLPATGRSLGLLFLTARWSPPSVRARCPDWVMADCHQHDDVMIAPLQQRKRTVPGRIHLGPCWTPPNR